MLTISPLISFSLGQSAFCVRANALLEKSFAQNFQIWQSDEGNWSIIAGADLLTANESIHETLVNAKDAQSPSVETVGDDRYRLAVPLLGQCEIDAVAVQEFSTNTPDLLLRLAESFQRHWVQSIEVERLKDENECFAEQVSQDLEELTFLRSLATALEFSDQSSGLDTIAKNVLPLLNSSVFAKWLGFVRAPKPGSDRPAISTSVGDFVLEENIAIALVTDHAKKCHLHPAVRNRIHQSDDSERYPGVRELVLTPIEADCHFYGWLMAVNCNQVASGDFSWESGLHEFGTQQASLMAAAASIMATQARNVDLLDEKQKLLVKVVRSLVSAVEAKDEYTRGHSERVALYGKRLSQQLGYSEEQAQRMYLTGLLHDVGKIGVSDATLKKTGKLTDQEFAEIKRHPHEGWVILHGLEPLKYVMPGVLQHHERFDGTGYPDGLLGEDISLDGRILAVADAYDAMTSDRPYRKGMSNEKAEAILIEGAGTQWDANVVTAFIDIRDDIHLIRNSYMQKERPLREGVEIAENNLEERSYKHEAQASES